MAQFSEAYYCMLFASRMNHHELPPGFNCLKLPVVLVVSSPDWDTGGLGFDSYAGQMF